MKILSSAVHITLWFVKPPIWNTNFMVSKKYSEVFIKVTIPFIQLNFDSTFFFFESVSLKLLSLFSKNIQFSKSLRSTFR